MKTMVAHGWRPAAMAISLLWLATLAGTVMVFLAQVVLARRLGPAEYGLFASSLATVTMIAPLAGFGLSQFRLKAYGSEGWAADRWLRPALRFSFVTTMVAIAGVVAWALWGNPVDADTRASLLLLTPVIIGVFAVDLIGSKLRLEERHRALAGWQLLMPSGRLAVALLAVGIAGIGARQVALGYGVVALLVAATAMPQLAAMNRGEMKLNGHGPRRAPPPSLETPGTWQLWSQAWAYGVAAALYPVFFQVSTVLLKYLDGNAQAGHYGVALAIMSALYLFPATVYQKYLLSRLHRWAVHDKPQFWRVYRLGNLAMLAMGLLTGLALWLLSPMLVSIAFGPAYADVVVLLSILAICAPIRFLSTSVGSALLTANHMRYRVLAMLVATVVAVALTWLLIPRLGAVGAAWATVVAEATLLLLMYLGVRRIRRPEAGAS
ncbi:polysaccharide biosynthesis C-terminal domain-containing protein [Lysobacter arenosi]|uniref:Polysaccharide biosynthesis C-terminal domain-containing protein n=1 Tax=Lysobacter arenosi TaxID=2795387 RepID=A0ABX7RFU9_9GAMM|nr:polysaccharide biosynthesis C-terminal domain-containing protein [Lysobacter arenosi]QSX75807.1 polysaccharide biosynthesis C-terminal domain-containing protein [Lysobacter arenosi]